MATILVTPSWRFACEVLDLVADEIEAKVTGDLVLQVLEFLHVELDDFPGIDVD